MFSLNYDAFTFSQVRFLCLHLLQFHIQANRDITRMEIFMSLVRLLEQTVKGSAGSGNGIENNNMMVHCSYPQAAPIPATGRPSGLQ